MIARNFRRGGLRQACYVVAAAVVAAACTIIAPHDPRPLTIPDHVVQVLKGQAINIRAPHDVVEIVQAFVRTAGATVVLEGRAPLLLEVVRLPEQYDDGRRPGVPLVPQTTVGVRAVLTRDDGELRTLVLAGEGYWSNTGSGASSETYKTAAVRALFSMR